MMHNALNKITPTNESNVDTQRKLVNSLVDAATAVPALALGAGGALGGYASVASSEAHTKEEKKNKFRNSILAALGGGAAGVGAAGLLRAGLGDVTKRAALVEGQQLGGAPIMLRKSQVKKLQGVDEEQNSVRRLMQDIALRTPSLLLGGQALKSITNRTDPSVPVGASIGAAAGANIGTAGTSALLAHLERASGKPLSFIQRAIPTLAATGLLAGAGGLVGNYIDRNPGRNTLSLKL